MYYVIYFVQQFLYSMCLMRMEQNIILFPCFAIWDGVYIFALGLV